jgi:hypothetical protein
MPAMVTYGGPRWSDPPSDPALRAEVAWAADRRDWRRRQRENAFGWLEDHGFDTAAPNIDGRAFSRALEASVQAVNAARGKTPELADAVASASADIAKPAQTPAQSKAAAIRELEHWAPKYLEAERAKDRVVTEGEFWAAAKSNFYSRKITRQMARNELKKHGKLRRGERPDRQSRSPK